MSRLRNLCDKPFNFIIPKMPPGHHARVDICAVYNGRAQWMQFALILDEKQLAFIARRINSVNW